MLPSVSVISAMKPLRVIEYFPRSTTPGSPAWPRVGVGPLMEDDSFSTLFAKLEGLLD